MTFDSKFNGQIKLTKNWRGQYSVWVGGFEQSGPVYVEKIWRDGLKRVPFVPKKVLILGLGCGTLVKLISKKWPRAKITGVEIDPVMINLGKKYFRLGEFPNLKIILSDAREFKPTRPFDLVLSDTYIGNKKISQNNLKKLGRKILVNSLAGTKNFVADEWPD